MPSSTKTLNAYVVKPYFLLDAWVVGGRHRHHRTRDHFGADTDLYVTISEPIGAWAAGTPIKYVIEDLFTRLTQLESSTRAVRICTLDALVLAPSTESAPAVPGVGLGVKLLDAIVFKNMTSDFTLRAFIGKGGTLTLDAWVPYRGTFYLNAFVVGG